MGVNAARVPGPAAGEARPRSQAGPVQPPRLGHDDDQNRRWAEEDDEARWLAEQIRRIEINERQEAQGAREDGEARRQAGQPAQRPAPTAAPAAAPPAPVRVPTWQEVGHPYPNARNRPETEAMRLTEQRLQERIRRRQALNDERMRIREQVALVPPGAYAGPDDGDDDPQPGGGGQVRVQDEQRDNRAGYWRGYLQPDARQAGYEYGQPAPGHGYQQQPIAYGLGQVMSPYQHQPVPYARGQALAPYGVARPPGPYGAGMQVGRPMIDQFSGLYGGRPYIPQGSGHLPPPPQMGLPPGSVVIDPRTGGRITYHFL